MWIFIICLCQTNQSEPLIMSQLCFVAKQQNINRSLPLSKVLEADDVEHLFGSLLPDMVQLALSAPELCTKVTAITNHWKHLFVKQ